MKDVAKLALPGVASLLSTLLISLYLFSLIRLGLWLIIVGISLVVVVVVTYIVVVIMRAAC